MANVMGTIGGDAELSPRGEQYALKLPDLVRQSVAVSSPNFFILLVSKFCRTVALSLYGLLP